MHDILKYTEAWITPKILTFNINITFKFKFICYLTKINVIIIPYIGLLSIYGVAMNPLGKVFSIIEIVVAWQDRGATYSDIIKESNLPKSSVHRILKELSISSISNFDPTTKRYFGSLRLAALGAEVMANFKPREHIHPLLLKLHQETKHTANFGILDGSHGVFVDKVESQDFGVKLFSEIGKTFPFTAQALARYCWHTHHLKFSIHC